MAAISIAVTTDKSADSSTNQPSQNTHLPLQAKVKNTGKMKEKLKKRLYVGGCSILFIPLILWHIGIHWRSSCEISICCESFKLYEGMLHVNFFKWYFSSVLVVFQRFCKFHYALSINYNGCQMKFKLFV
eukprot:TRINITY_DN5188_c0_g1_i3.p1 TRINITY_DN5188_c0_g1~~TRINITY_DN5188_c0_g1_i3.p1  ORF type:complete len:130 (+),score=2.96 TRINITY_DN5188_c0_g1_i3:296-685(+)